MRFRLKWVVFACLLAMQWVTTAQARDARPKLRVVTTGGKTFDLSAQQGHWVIINYWATWCAACLEEMPMLHRFADAHPNIRVIGLTYEHITDEALHRFLAAHPVGYSVARLDESTLPRALKPVWFGMHALPLTYAIAPDGTVAKRWVGELNSAKLRAEVGRGSQP